jgi:hypothetical protein
MITFLFATLNDRPRYHRCARIIVRSGSNRQTRISLRIADAIPPSLLLPAGQILVKKLVNPLGVPSWIDAQRGRVRRFIHDPQFLRLTSGFEYRPRISQRNQLVFAPLNHHQRASAEIRCGLFGRDFINAA